MNIARSRRQYLKLILATVLAFGIGTPSWADNAKQLRIGYQKYGPLTLLKARGNLEQRLKPLGVEVKWTEFPAGPQLLEGLNVGSIDFGITGEAPPIFAQAAQAPLVYVAHTPPAPTSEAIVVPRHSAIKSVADLKGKRVVLNKGSNVHYLLVKALEKSGVKYSDVNVAYLPPSDARAAFERGSVDAWVIWDPFLAAAQKQLGARVLVDGRGLVNNHLFYLAAKPYAEQNPGILKAIFEEQTKADQWGKANPKDVVALLSPLLGLDTGIVDLSVSRLSYGITPLSAHVTAEQQKIADAFADLKLIPKRLSISEAVWQPKR